ncbi:MFS general substrate transporter [Mollisia scopiformis]|uniref:MFS general substrate transporter n=1 Tax=Mollisia scopiformis TaxID=149040 RepID=A0A194WU87_MOLSC|nr:MFS general substrate transporter [Mollisia scopiformis]KUJ11239.1 MFS general substrate transporter [Mollisia scopiformis]
MQSLLQYRRLGLAVQKQIQRDHEKTNYPSSHLPAVPEDQGQVLQDATNSSNGTDSEDDNPMDLGRIGSVITVRTQNSLRTTLGHALTGIHARERLTHEGKGGKVFVVGWEGESDPSNPRNWSVAYRACITLIVSSIGFVVGAASSADTAILPQAAAEFGVSDVVESMTIGLYLAGYAVGAIFAGPLSETFGRNAVYISTMIIYMIFIMASALAPNIGAQLSFRFLAGAFGATPLTCAGGSISDLWPTLEKTWSFPLYAIPGFGGPVLGPVIASYIINLGSWRWSEWIILIISGVGLGLIVLFQPETYPPLLLVWKAKHLRQKTCDDRFRAEMEIVESTLWSRLKIALTRPLVLALEPIVLFMTLYLTVLYIVLFTFLDGYPYIFQRVYGTSQGLTNVIFTGIFVGIVLASFLVPWVYRITKESFGRNAFVPEVRLWFAMLGAPAIPISLFWMAWTDFDTISIWSSIMASVLLGYGIICIFMTAYMYIIDSYEVYAASALTFVTFTRYMTAGGMTVVGVPFYENLGPHMTLTIMACINVLMTPIPYVFYKYGHKIRQRSKNAVSWT